MHGIFLHAAISLAAALIGSFLDLPVLTLQGLHTYIHPDSLPAADGSKALLRRPSALASSLPDPKRRFKSKDCRPSFDESKAQLFRLRLTDSLLPSRVFLSSFRSSFLTSFISLCNIYMSISFQFSDPFTSILFAAVLISASHLLISLLSVSLERSASRLSDRRVSLLSALISFLATLIVLIHMSPSIFDFRIPIAVAPAAACLAGFLGGVLFTPASRAARCFWLGTDQLRWNLSAVSCGTLGRVLLYASIISSFFSSLLWVKPLALAERFEDWRVWALAAAAGSQLLVLRTNVQMFLNEAVLCWYQRLHSSSVPDLDYGRTKVFLHNHYVCLVAIQFFAPPVLVLLFIGLSLMRDNLFGGGIPFAHELMYCSDLVKEMALFIAWWIMFVRSLLMLLFLALYSYSSELCETNFWQLHQVRFAKKGLGKLCLGKALE